MLSRATIIIIAPFQRNFTNLPVHRLFFARLLVLVSSLCFAHSCNKMRKWRASAKETEDTRNAYDAKRRNYECFFRLKFSKCIRAMSERALSVCMCRVAFERIRIFVIEFWYSHVCDFHRNNIIPAFFTMNSQFSSFSSPMCDACCASKKKWTSDSTKSRFRVSGQKTF